MEGQSLLWLVLVACVTNARSLDSIVPSTLDPSVEEVKKLRSDRLGALHAQEYRRASHLSRRINDLTAGAAVLSDVRASPANISGPRLEPSPNRKAVVGLLIQRQQSAVVAEGALNEVLIWTSGPALPTSFKVRVECGQYLHC